MFSRATFHDYAMRTLPDANSSPFQANDCPEASKPGNNESKRCDDDTVVETVYAQWHQHGDQ